MLGAMSQRICFVCFSNKGHDLRDLQQSPAENSSKGCDKGICRDYRGHQRMFEDNWNDPPANVIGESHLGSLFEDLKTLQVQQRCGR